MLHVNRVSDEAYIGSPGSVKENSAATTRLGWVQARLLELLARLGVRDFNLSEAARVLDVDVRRLHQAVAYLMKRNIIARLRRGWYKVLVDPWELLKAAVVQGPNSSRAGGVKENHGTRSAVGVGSALSVVGVFFDNVRGYTWGGFYVHGDRGRVLGRGDLGRFMEVSYGEVSVATGTRLFEGLGVLVVYFRCKGFGPYTICSDWVEWRPPRGFYKQHSVVGAVSVVRSKVLPFGFGLIARSGVVVGAGLERFRAALYGLARRLYLVVGPGFGGGLG
jgi:hypothetical protein